MSNPFAADQGKPCFFTFSWRFRAVMSTANAWRQEFRRVPEQDRQEEVQLAYFSFVGIM